ncbi:MAG: preprotein translocase subunit SecY [Candidatus Paceibacterota bacterium]
MKTFFAKIKSIFQDRILRKRILFTLGALVVFRLFAAIPIPGVDTLKLQALFAGNDFLNLFNIFSGGGFSNLSIVMIGVSPYITASIIMQLSTIMSPRLKALYQEEGDAGRKKFSQYSRMLTVPIAAVQAFGFLALLRTNGVLASISGFDQIVNIAIIVAGAMLLMWIGELISEYGIGNGLSLIIFAGIVSRLPSGISQLALIFEPSQIPTYILFVAVTLVVIAGVVVITEAERPIPITYAKRVRGAKVYGGVSTYLPLRLNQAGVIPIIFALSILLFPQMIFNFLHNVNNATFQSVSRFVLDFLNNGWIHGVLYFFLVFIFTYFYTAVTFDPDSISTNLQKGGAFIPGVRPGQSTSDHIARILTRLTLFGALFLGIIAVLPLVVKAGTGITAFSVGGTALLIVVSVVIDLIKKTEAQISIREY